jgi:hypothetical protein
VFKFPCYPLSNPIVTPKGVAIPDNQDHRFTS